VHASFGDRVVEAWRRYRSWRLFAGPDAHMLKDIGVTLAEVEHEASKPFWVLAMRWCC
jgi:uncharacterized protein YjiS (DUF1127 family)